MKSKPCEFRLKEIQLVIKLQFVNLPRKKCGCPESCVLTAND